MRRPLGRCLVCLALAAAGGVLSACGAGGTDARSIHGRLVGKELVTDRFDPVLRQLLTIVPIRHGREINVTRRYDPAKVNLLVVDSQAYEDAGRPGAPGRLPFAPEALYLNALAVPPNLIVVDSDWLTMLLLAARSRIEAWPNAETAADGASLHQLALNRFGVDDARRGVMVESFLDRSGGGRDAYRRAAAGLLDTAASSEEELRKLALTAGLSWAPFLAHELAHLDGGAGTGGANPFDAVDALLTAPIRQEEERADRVALESLEPVIGLLNGMTRQDDHLAAVGGTIASLPLESSALLQRDLVLHRVFDGFRGAAFHEVGLTLFYSGCEPDNPERIDPLSFDRVIAAMPHPLPALTEGELAKLREYVDPAAYRTHVHGFERAAELLGRLRLADELWGSSQVADFLGLLEHARSGAPLVWPSDGPMGRMDLTLEAFMEELEGTERRFGDRYLTERLTYCGAEECHLLRQVAVPGRSESEFAEVWAEDGYVTFIRYRYPIFTGSALTGEVGADDPVVFPAWLTAKLEEMARLSPQPPVDDPRVTYHMMNLVHMTSLMTGAGGRMSLQHLMETTALAQVYALRCGAGTVIKDLPDRTLIARPTLTANAVETLVLGKLPAAAARAGGGA